MPITIRCPNPDCGQKYTVREESLGSRTTCKKCGTGFTVEMRADETGAPKPPASSGSAAGKRSGPIEGQAKMAVPPGPASPARGSRPPAPSPRPTAPDPRPPGPAPVSPAGGSPPKKIGPYTVRRKLGQGGMGEVWLAHDPSLDRDVAIKTLPARFAAKEDRLKRFLREARLAAKLHHTNAVTVYSVGQEGSLVYIAMEYVDGQSLDNAVSEGRPMPWREATRAIRDAAAGLGAAHKLGMVHRDIKPANLMRTRDGVTKVADFGLARSQFSDSRLTQDGSVFGTPAYMSPEQWQGAKVDGRSDLYSLVCAYYCLLTGQDPFGDVAPGALGYMHCHQPVPDPRQLSPQLPDAVCRILARGLKKKPEERYQSAAELAADLEALLALPETSLTSRNSSEQLQASPSMAGGTASRVRVPTVLVPATTAVWRGAGALASVAGRGRAWWKWLALPGFAFAAGGLLAVVLSIQTGGGTVKIELSDAAAKVTVKVDGDVIDIAGLKEPLRLKAGGHDLLVTSGDYQSVSKSFSVRQGEHEVLHVTLEPKVTPAAPVTAAGKTSPSNLPTNMKEVSVELGKGVKMEMVLIPAGEFMMGEGGDAHKVAITKPFYLGKYLVTQEQWQTVMDDVMDNNPSEFKGPKNPVETVSWDDCQRFLKKLNGRFRPPRRSPLPTGEWEFRLPTEAQWEYACRAGSAGKYCFGDDEFVLRDYAWFGANSDLRTHPVGLKKPNAFGLFDMHGNVQEWCADWFGEYKASPASDPTGAPSGSYRSFRGGEYSSQAGACGSSVRYCYTPWSSPHKVGFRASFVPAAKPEAKVAERPQNVSMPTEPSAPASTGEKTAPGNFATSLKETSVELGGGVKMEMVLIPAGEFMMGSPDSHNSDNYAELGEKPQRRVRIDQPFYLGKYPVTQEQYEAVTGENPSEFKGPKQPVEHLTLEGYEQFLDKLNQNFPSKGGKFQLPSEAQWEYACRAGSTTPWYFGDDKSQLGDYAWYKANSEGRTHPVGEKKPNAWGLYDMHGNVWQRCSTPLPSYSPTYGILRGGSYSFAAEFCRSTSRWGGEPGYGDQGFRVALVLADK